MNAVTTKQHVQLPRTLDTDQLAQHQAQARQKLLEGVYTGYQWVYPCAEKISFNSFQQALEVTQEMTKAGRELYPHDFPEHSGLYYAASYWRTPEEIEAILQQSDLEVEAQYKFEIEEFNQAQVTLLAEQLYQAQKAKEDKLLKDKEDKAKTKALEEAQAFIQSQLKEGIK
jgi:hypothetical protein